MALSSGWQQWVEIRLCIVIKFSIVSIVANIPKISSSLDVEVGLIPLFQLLYNILMSVRHCASRQDSDLFH